MFRRLFKFSPRGAGARRRPATVQIRMRQHVPSAPDIDKIAFLCYFIIKYIFVLDGFSIDDLKRKDRKMASYTGGGSNVTLTTGVVNNSTIADITKTGADAYAR